MLVSLVLFHKKVIQMDTNYIVLYIKKMQLANQQLLASDIKIVGGHNRTQKSLGAFEAPPYPIIGFYPALDFKALSTKYIG
jgi:hypothetical protein